APALGWDSTSQGSGTRGGGGGGARAASRSRTTSGASGASIVIVPIASPREASARTDSFHSEVEQASGGTSMEIVWGGGPDRRHEVAPAPGPSTRNAMTRAPDH